MASPDSPSPQPSSKRVRPKTYVAAVYLSLAVALIPVAALVSIFWLRHKVKIDTEAPAMVSPRDLPAPSKTLTMPLPGSAPAHAGAPASPSLQPTLGAARLQVPVDPVRHVAELDQQAYVYLQQGEYDLARVALLEAENIDPRHIPTLRYEAELAEAERDWSHAALYWQRLIDLGTAPGDVQALARQRLAAIKARPATPAPAAPAAVASAPKPVPAPAAAPAPAPTPTPTAPVPAAPAPAVAALSGPAFHVEPTVSTPLAKPGFSGFTLRIPIAPSSATQVIDPGKVGIKLYFYDQLQNDLLVPTNAHLEVAFENSRPNWAQGRTEMLKALYQRADPQTQLYYGYIFRLYYDGVLIEERSTPPTLLSQFPAAQ